MEKFMPDQEEERGNAEAVEAEPLEAAENEMEAGETTADMEAEKDPTHREASAEKPEDRTVGGEAAAEEAEKREREEKARLEEVRERIAAKEKQEEKPEETSMERDEDKTPEEKFEECRQEDFKKRQQEEYSLKEKAVNEVLEWEKFKEWRQERAENIVGGLAALVENSIAKGKIENLVDLGCGQGEIMRALLDRLKVENPGVRGIGVDSTTRVAQDRLEDDAAFYKGDAANTGLAQGSVDLVNMNYLLQALEEEVQEQVLAEVKRILSDGGHMLFVDVVKRPGLSGRVDKLKHQVLNSFPAYNPRTQEEWKAFLEKNGFEIVDETMAGDRSVGLLVRVKREESDNL